MQLLFDGDRIQVTFDRHRSKVLCVTFSDHFRPEGSFRSGFGQEPLSAAKITTVHVKSSFNHWWQTQEVHPAITVIKAVIAGYCPDRVITYGASMGGYGALHFARELGAQRSFALSPQTDLWGDDETRWRQEAADWPRILPHISEVTSNDCEYIVVVDPREKLDAKQASGLPSAKLIQLPNCGHRSVPLLAELGHLKRIMISAIEGVSFEEIEAETLKAVSIGKRQSSTYLSHLLTRLMWKRRHKHIRRILQHMQSGSYLRVDAIHPRDYITIMRVAAETKSRWLVDELFVRSGGAEVKEPMRSAFLQTLKRNNFEEHVKVIEMASNKTA